MRTAISVWCALLLRANTACDDESASRRPQAVVTEGQVTAPQRPSERATEYSFDQALSSIEFAGAKPTRRHSGKFGSFAGTIRLVDRDLSRGSISLSVDVSSLQADDRELTRHLKSPDFLDVERFPKATFSSTSITAGGEDGASHTVAGDLTLHGVTKRISFPARIKAMSAAVEAAAEFTISRKDFGVVYSGLAGDLIKDEVLLMVRLDARSGLLTKK